MQTVASLCATACDHACQIMLFYVLVYLCGCLHGRAQLRQTGCDQRTHDLWCCGACCCTSCGRSCSSCDVEPRSHGSVGWALTHGVHYAEGCAPPVAILTTPAAMARIHITLWPVHALAHKADASWPWIVAEGGYPVDGSRWFRPGNPT